MWKSIHVHKTTQSDNGYDRIKVYVLTALHIPNLKVINLRLKQINIYCEKLYLQIMFRSLHMRRVYSLKLLSM